MLVASSSSSTLSRPPLALVLLLALLSTTLSGATNDVTFVDNGYENVVVSISDRLDKAQCPVIVRNLWVFGFNSEVFGEPLNPV
ncbi:unnamed protein product [Notodromas monacha]|uniref:Uncharacterized protein n=1 Tax=Notodromas monacha TaxID=399045 RepID=A0A7R9GHN8_9CRUS|nr:unnamed protein product [Notodromas monacha]CAG0921555.1 unnamed protein product [Notodromas monacha]